MMKAFSRWLTRRHNAWLVISVVVLVAGWSVLRATQVENDDDILAFLPQDNPDVETFRQVNRLFGSLDLALVGIESDDVYRPDFLRRLQEATRELKETRGINHVLTMSNVVDFAPDPRGGVVTTPLVYRIPANRREVAELRARVQSKEHVLGRLVSRDGRAVLLYCFLAYGSDPLTMAGRIRKVVREHFPGERKYWGGGPFVSTYIYESTRSDIHRLTPWAVAVVVLILLLAFRDIIGVGLVLLSTGVGILFSLAVMSVLGVRFNIVLGSMPVILFAVGSAYGIHILARYYALARRLPGPQAVRRTVTEAAPVVIAAGLTTAVGLLSFLAMDIAPLRSFGLFTSVGILATLLLAVTFIPAVLYVARLRRDQGGIGVLRAACRRLALTSRRHRAAWAAALALLALAGAAFTGRVRTSMDTTSFYSAGSPPARAEQFMRRHFGGSLFVQVYLQADLGQPAMLRLVQQLADRVSLLEQVSDVMQVSEAIAQANEAFVGQRRIPDTPQQVALLHSLLASDPAVEQLITRDRRRALLHFKLRPAAAEQVEQVLEKIEKLTREQVPAAVKLVTRSRAGEAGRRLWREQLRLRLSALAARRGLAPQAVAASLPALEEKIPPDRDEIERRLAHWLASAECAVDLGSLDRRLPATLARILASAGPPAGEDELRDLLRRQLGERADEELVEDLLLSLQQPLEQFWQEARAGARARAFLARSGWQVAGPARARLERDISMALLENESPTLALPTAAGEAGAMPVVARVTGLPVMHRGLSASATSNQLRSLVFALVFVLLVMAWYFRSWRVGLLVSSPTMFTLLVIYGGMGLLGVRLDIGTAMLASLVLGAGVDYAVHLASAWQARPGQGLDDAAARAAAETGPAIWINAVCVAVGFLILTLGESRPLKNVGGLTAAAMLVAAAATFLLLPLLARRESYRNPEPEEDEPLPAGEANTAAGPARR